LLFTVSSGITSRFIHDLRIRRQNLDVRLARAVGPGGADLFYMAWSFRWPNT
jgi:hypothetical protein